VADREATDEVGVLRVRAAENGPKSLILHIVDLMSAGPIAGVLVWWASRLSSTNARGSHESPKEDPHADAWPRCQNGPGDE
jgi:hypothetical protein